ncbi:MAG: TadE/TadG family type IV pilus assembly protein [Terriglobia bacterium]
MTEMHKESRRPAPPNGRLRFRFRAKRALRLVRAEEGSTVLEMALVLPVLMLTLVGIMTFGLAFYNQITLTNAVNNAAQVLMAGSGVITDPCASVNNALAAAAPSLNNPAVYGPAAGKLSYTIQAYTTTTGSTPAVGPYAVVFPSGGISCASEAANLTEHYQVIVTATYGCNLTVLGHNFAPTCLLTAQTSEVVQ